MKLVVVHDFAHASLGAGATRCAIDGAAIFARQGVDVTFLAASGDPDPDLIAAGVRTITLSQPDIRRSGRRGSAVVQGMWNSLAAKRLRDVIGSSDLASTIFHVHTWSKALSPSVLPLLMGTGVRAIFHLHEYFSACPNGGFFEYPRLRICHRTPLGVSCLTTNCDSRSPAHKMFRIARHGTMKYAGYPAGGSDFIVLSDLQRRVLTPYLPAQADIHLMRNPIDIAHGALLPRSAAAKYLYVGRLSREKGIDTLAAAFAGRAEDLIVIGDGPDADLLRAKLPGAEYRGWQRGPDVHRAMRESRALIFPSLWYEGMPMVIFEALSAGLPVIASDASSAAEVIEPGANGIVVPSGDANALAIGLRVLDDPATAETLSRTAYTNYWADPLSHDRYYSDMSSLYERKLRKAA